MKVFLLFLRKKYYFLNYYLLLFLYALGFHLNLFDVAKVYFLLHVKKKTYLCNYIIVFINPLKV